MVWSLSSRNVKNPSGNTKECGRISQGLLVSGLIWITHMSHMMTTLSSLSGGHSRQIWDKKLLYKGFKIVPYCPRCGTPLSAQEVAQGYKTVKGTFCNCSLQGCRVKMLTSSHGPQHRGHFQVMWLFV